MAKIMKGNINHNSITWMSTLLWLILPFLIFAVFDLSSVFYINICCLITSLEKTYFVILYVITAIFEERTQGWGIKRVSMYVKLLEIWALWCRVRWVSREEQLCPSNNTRLDIYFNSLGQICIPTSGLSACGVSVFLGQAFLYKLKWTALLTIGRNEHQISLAGRVWGKRDASQYQISSKSIVEVSRLFDFSRWQLQPS